MANKQTTPGTTSPTTYDPTRRYGKWEQVPRHGAHKNREKRNRRMEDFIKVTRGVAVAGLKKDPTGKKG